MRTLSPEALAALAAGTVIMALLVRVDLDGGPLCLNSSRLTLTVGGEDYVGAGHLGEVGPIPGQPGEMPRLQLAMSGVQPAHVSMVLTEPVRGRDVRISLALFPAAGGAPLDVQLLYLGQGDVLALSRGDGSATVTLATESGVRDLLRPCGLLYTHADQQRLHPGDMGLQYVSAQVEQRIVWPSREFFEK